MLRTALPALLLLLLLIPSGCSSGLTDAIRFNTYKEQLYVDAKLNFSVKHPQAWQRIKVAVSSPEYRADRVTWEVENPREKSEFVGKMVILSHPADRQTDLADLLSRFLFDQAELKAGQTQRCEHPVGPALKLIGQDNRLGRLTVAIKGRQNDFILAFSYPDSHFDELLPIFEEIVSSFREIAPETASAATTTQ